MQSRPGAGTGVGTGAGAGAGTGTDTGAAARARPAGSFAAALQWLLTATFAAIVLRMFWMQGPSSLPAPPSGSQTPHHRGSLRNARGHVLITGGAGYIGSHASLRLLEEGWHVTVIDNFSRGNRGAVARLEAVAASSNARLRVVEADLGHKGVLLHALRTAQAGELGRVDCVMHFAAVAFVGESMRDPLLYYRNITANTMHVLEDVVRYAREDGPGRPAPAFIFSSSCATYGTPEKVPVREDTPQLPTSPYGQAKLMSERVILDTARALALEASREPLGTRLPVGILRYFNVVGADARGRLGEFPRNTRPDDSRISSACFDAAFGRRPHIEIRGTDFDTRDGTAVRDYIHVADLVDAHLAVMNALLPRTGQSLAATSVDEPLLYVLGTGFGVTVKEFVQVCLNATADDETGVPRVTVVESPRRLGDSAVVYADPSKIERELGWRAQHRDLLATLRGAWEFRRATEGLEGWG